MQDDGIMPCDPKRANKEIIKEETYREQRELWTPYKDDNGTEIGF
jgi:hypothetical protein